MHKDLFQGNNGSLPFGSCLVDLTENFSIVLLQSFAGTYPKVPSPSFPKSSKSRILEHPLNRTLPFWFLSRDDAAISSLNLFFAPVMLKSIRRSPSGFEKYKDRVTLGICMEV